MKIAYINCSNGVSGDMLLSAFISAGVKHSELENLLKRSLKLKGWNLRVERNRVFHVPVMKTEVLGDHRFRSPAEIRKIIAKSSFSPELKDRCLRILNSLVQAEAKVHRVPLTGVHFHELNSIDTLIDIAGACLCLDLANVKEVYASPVNIGSPMPAAMEILRERKVPVFSSDTSFELTTPTGAAIISEIVSRFGDMPEMKIEASGFGSGTKKSSKGFSLLKLFVGETAQESAVFGDEVILLETNIDDMDPRIYPYVTEKLFSAGAKDVWMTQVLMKKGRPGIVLSALSSPDYEKKLVDVLFRETTTLGIRRFAVPRYILKRKVRGDRKIGFLGKGKAKVKSEFEIVKREAHESGRPLSDSLI